MGEEIPLIYTSKGNVPVNSLAYTHSWEQSPEHIKFAEEWRDETGEVVKSNVHLLKLTGVEMQGSQAAL